MCPAITSPLPLGPTCSTSIPFTTSTLTCRAHALERMAGKLPVDPGSPPKSALSSALLRCHPPPTAFPASTLPLTACPPPPPLPSSAPPCPLPPPSKAAWASRRARTACCFLVRVLCSISLNLAPVCDAHPNRRRSPNRNCGSQQARPPLHIPGAPPHVLPPSPSKRFRRSDSSARNQEKIQAVRPRCGAVSRNQQRVAAPIYAVPSPPSAC